MPHELSECHNLNLENSCKINDALTIIIINLNSLFKNVFITSETPHGWFYIFRNTHCNSILITIL